METRTLRVLTGGDDGETLLADGMGDPNPIPTSAASSTPSASGAASPRPTWWDEARARRVGLRRRPWLLQGRDARRASRSTASCSRPGRYVGAEEQEDDGEPFEEKYPRLLAELEEELTEGERLTAVVRARLAGFGE